jgi:hypothetical protein
MKRPKEKRPRGGGRRSRKSIQQTLQLTKGKRYGGRTRHNSRLRDDCARAWLWLEQERQYEGPRGAETHRGAQARPKGQLKLLTELGRDHLFRAAIVTRVRRCISRLTPKMLA